MLIFETVSSRIYGNSLVRKIVHKFTVHPVEDRNTTSGGSDVKVKGNGVSANKKREVIQTYKPYHTIWEISSKKYPPFWERILFLMQFKRFFRGDVFQKIKLHFF